MVTQQHVRRPTAYILLLLGGYSKPAAPASRNPNLLVARLVLIPGPEAPQLLFASQNPDQGFLDEGLVRVLLGHLQDYQRVLVGPGVLLLDDLWPVLRRLRLAESLAILLQGVVVLLEQCPILLLRPSRLLGLTFMCGRHHRDAKHKNQD